MADDAFETFKRCAVEVLQVSPEQVTKDARFGDDLDADSLDLAELVMALEDEFDITVEEEELEGVRTVGQAFDLVSGKV
ncbi:MAG: acyl carrier protein [Acidimicrobiales bacterium]